MSAQGISSDQAAWLTLAAIRSTAQGAEPSWLRSYVIDLTNDLDLPDRKAAV